MRGYLRPGTTKCQFCKEYVRKRWRFCSICVRMAPPNLMGSMANTRGGAGLDRSPATLVAVFLVAARRGTTASLTSLLVTTGYAVLPWGLLKVIEGELQLRALGASWAWLLYHASVQVGPLLAMPTLVELMFILTPPLPTRRRIASWSLGAALMAAIGGYETWKAVALYEPFARSVPVALLYTGASLGLGALSFGMLSQRGHPKLRIGTALCLVGVSAGAAWASGRALPDQYPTVHLSAFVFELLALQLALTEVVRPLRSERKWRWLSTMPLLVLLAVMTTGWTTTLSISELALVRQNALPGRGLLMQVEFAPYRFSCPDQASSSTQTANSQSAASGNASPERELRTHMTVPSWPALSKPNPNLLLVSVESLRPDLLSFSRPDGREPGTLSDWVERATWFPRAYAAAPRTLHSIGAVMTLSPTSRVPLALSAQRSWMGALLPEAETLAEVFAAQGSVTFAHHHSLGIGAQLTGLTQGFSRARGYPAEKDRDALHVDETIVANALQELKGIAADQPFFGWLFLASPHSPWFTEEAPPRRERSRDAFINEVRRAERALNTLLDGLSATGRLDNTIVVIFGDHGEGLGERNGQFGHGFTPYEEQIRAATLVFHPNSEGGRFEQPISILHILSSLLLPRSDSLADFARRKLAEEQLPLLRSTDYSIVVERLAPQEPKIALIRGNQKWIHGYATELTEAYDLGADPNESEDRWRPHPDEQRQARALLHDYGAWHGCQHRYSYEN